MGNCLPQIAPMWVLLMGSSSQWVVPVWAPSMGYSAPVWDPCGGHKSCQQTCSSTGSSVHGSTGPGMSLLQHGLLCPWLYRSWQEPAPAQVPLSMALQVLSGTCSSMGFPQAFLDTLLLPAWGALWAAGDLCPSIDLHGMQGHILPQFSAPWATGLWHLELFLPLLQWSCLQGSHIFCVFSLFCWSHSGFVVLGFFCLVPLLNTVTQRYYHLSRTSSCHSCIWL